MQLVECDAQYVHILEIQRINVKYLELANLEGRVPSRIRPTKTSRGRFKPLNFLILVDADTILFQGQGQDCSRRNGGVESEAKFLGRGIWNLLPVLSFWYFYLLVMLYCFIILYLSPLLDHILFTVNGLVFVYIFFYIYLTAIYLYDYVFSRCFLLLLITNSTLSLNYENKLKPRACQLV